MHGIIVYSTAHFGTWSYAHFRPSGIRGVHCGLGMDFACQALAYVRFSLWGSHTSTWSGMQYCIVGGTWAWALVHLVVGLHRTIIVPTRWAVVQGPRRCALSHISAGKACQLTDTYRLLASRVEYCEPPTGIVTLASRWSISPVMWLHIDCRDGGERLCAGCDPDHCRVGLSRSALGWLRRPLCS